jgi:hypothetical protein
MTLQRPFRFKRYNFSFESFSINVYMWKWWVAKLWALKLDKILKIQDSTKFNGISRPFVTLMQLLFPIKDYITIILPSLSFDACYELGGTWFIYAPFWVQFMLIIFLFDLCKLISSQTFACEFFIVLSRNSFCWVRIKECILGLHSIAKLRIN